MQVKEKDQRNVYRSCDYLLERVDQTPLSATERVNTGSFHKRSCSSLDDYNLDYDQIQFIEVQLNRVAKLLIEFR